MRKMLFVISLAPIAVVSVVAGVIASSEMASLLGLSTHSGVLAFMVLTSLVFGVCGTICFRLFRLRLTISGGRYVITDDPRVKKMEAESGNARG